MCIRKIFAILITLCLFFPMIWMATGHGEKPNDFIMHENRPKNSFKYDGLKTLPVNIDRWFSDSYGFRSKLIKKYKRIQKKVFSVSDSNNCVIGKNGYLFLGNSYDKVIDEYTNSLYFDDKIMKDLVLKFKQDKRLADRVNAYFIILVAPDKHSLYPEMLPPYIAVKANKNFYSEAVLSLRKAGLNILDIKAQFIKKYTYDHERLYYKTDTHWSALGAYYAYYEMMLSLRQRYPDIKILPKPTFVEEKYHLGYDLVNICGFSGQKQDDFKMTYSPVFDHLINMQTGAVYKNDAVGNTVDAVDNTNALNDLTILVDRDSFGISMFPFFVATFKRVVYVHHNIDNNKKLGVAAMALKYKPDIFISEFAERKLYWLSIH